MPMTAELSPSKMHTARRIEAAQSGWTKASAALANRDLVVVAIFSGIGLLASLWLVSMSPFADDVAALLAQLS